MSARSLRLVTGAGGVLLLVALFLPWAERDGVSATGWQLLPTGDALFVVAATAAIVVALTGGRVGLFRPDMSLRAAADLLGLVTTLVLVWLILFDFPQGAQREPGLFLALVAAVAISCGAADWRVVGGAPLFPPVHDAGEGSSSPGAG